MSLVNGTLHIFKINVYCRQKTAINYFAEKNLRSLCSAKAPQNLFAKKKKKKNISRLVFLDTRRLNKFLTDDFAKLMMLRTSTGP